MMEPFFLSHHHLRSGFDGEEVTLEVGREYGIPAFFFHADEKSVAGDPCIIHKDIQLTKFFLDRFENAIHIFCFGDIALDGEGFAASGFDFTLDSFCGSLAAGIVQCDSIALRSQCKSDGSANTAGSPRDESSLFDSFHHYSPFSAATTSSMVATSSAWWQGTERAIFFMKPVRTVPGPASTVISTPPATIFRMDSSQCTGCAA